MNQTQSMGKSNVDSLNMHPLVAHSPATQNHSVLLLKPFSNEPRSQLFSLYSQAEEDCL